DPHEYQHAKRRLRNAVTEHYRGLEVLNQYRILNLAGFRKVLKKYERVTKIPVMEAYMQQKVEPSTFASGAVVAAMLKETERHFAMRFERGDRKKARGNLRVGPSSKTHHFSTFRSGLWLGLAIPAIGGGSYLLLLSLLIGVNILVWTRKRISYAFIFGMLPSLLLCTLAYAFWFSLARIGPPMLWPLIWLALTLVVMLNPIRSFMWGPARWWTIKNVAKLGACGIRSVRFTDVWLGLVYSLSNLYFVGCFYTRFANYASTYDSQVQEAWSTCSVTQNWEWYYLLSMLPFMVRFMQSLRRYRDSKHSIHLINAGKYMMAIIYYFCYFYWKHQGCSPHTGKSYILWCFTATVDSIYGCAWDFLMDWSVCRPHARYPLLRRQLVYKSHVPVSNLCIRFIWVTYIFLDGTNATLFSFIAALLEMLRRVQWNFYRLENQHLGNMGRYQVTREIPLPYRFDVRSSEDRISV
ncbi:EXS family-domain-containing protein, partial [Boletus edulis BED1]